ncbi:class C sortase [Microbacterium sp. A84]|uniref:class C sortase n=1 Tax=Microbacterium sp. A84 TaxID=3450715 RepID=UPI003F43FB66
MSTAAAEIETRRSRSRRTRRRGRRWRPSLLTLTIALFALAGLGAGLYPMTASWLSSYNQSQIIRDYEHSVDRVTPSATDQLANAHAYNDALSAGVVFGANANVPVGEGASTNESLEYSRMLTASDSGLMGRVRIPQIDVDLPIYHGTSDDVLLKGVGHLEGSHLPVGGEGAHAVLTAHRGLANATMFTNLDGVEVGDQFTVEVFGEVLTYEVRTKEVIDPADTGTLRAEPGSDLVTLITCTPLGINSHRIVVTGERVALTQSDDVAAAGLDPTIPGFPWWAVFLGGGLLVVSGYVGWQGRIDARIAARRARR